jgi:spermidine/putrescine transport system substrate-binding protein
MKRLLCGAAMAALIAGIGADGALARELQLYNWGNYTGQDLLEKFEAETGIRVIVTDYDSNDTALTKIEAGAHGFDMVVPSANYVQIFVEKGLLMEVDYAAMENFQHLDPRWVDVAWDPGRRYTIPWQWGTTGVAVNTSVYSGDPNTSDIWLNPPEELKGRINVVPEMNDVMALAILYEGGEPCTTDRDLLRRVRDRLQAASADWMSMDYGMTERLASADVSASVNWNGSTFRARLLNPDVVYGYPREGYPLWMDSIGILSDARNVEEAKEFINFIMLPENAAMISNFARYANGTIGSEPYMDEVMRDAPEIVPPEELAAAGVFLPTCPAEAQQLYSAIWTELQK